jgi:hypothetical protein
MEKALESQMPVRPKSQAAEWNSEPANARANESTTAALPSDRKAHRQERSLLERFARALSGKRTLPHHRIEIRLRTIEQLFDSMDPSPFHEKDLDRDAEEFLVSWVQEYHRHDPVSLMIHVENLPEGQNPKAEVERAVHNYFAYRAKLNRREFKHMMKQGRMSLLIGLTFLATCLLMGNLITGWVDAPLSSLLREAFLIAGWVAMWRPMQIYLYDWWPLRRRGQIFEKMSRMAVALKLTPR